MRAHPQQYRAVRRLIGTAIFIVAVLGRSTLYAQAPTPTPTLAAAATIDTTASPVEAAPELVRLLVGRSTIVRVGKPIARVSLTSADVADALVTSSDELLVNGKAAGTISMFVWDRAGAIRRYEVVVQRDLARLSAQLKELFPKESIDVRANGRSAVLSGSVSSKDVADKMASLAGSFVENKEELVSLLQVGPAGRSNQVLLRVRFAEISRSAMSELGVSLFTSPTGVKSTIGRVTTQQFPSVGFDGLEYTKPADALTKFGVDPTSNSGKFTFSDFLNLFLFSEKYDLGTMIKALQAKGLFQSLAEPNLVAESGKEASFLAGGEFPIPIAQGSGAGTSISVQFKEFGIRLSFTPTVIGNRVHLKVKPEVSALDFSNAVSLNGFRIPALSTRRTETEVELNDGQTFAIAGLMNNTMNSTISKIPGLGDIPILGLLFKSKAAQRNQTELVVMITPEILRNDSPGVTPDLPAMTEPFLPPIEPNKVVPTPAPAFSTTVEKPAAPVAGNGAAAPVASANQSSPAAAARPTSQSAATRAVVRAPDQRPAAAAAPSRASDTPAASAPRRPTADERRAEEQVRRQALKDQETARKAAAEAKKRSDREAVETQRAQRTEAARLARLEREQSALAAEKAARDAEQAKRQAAIDREHARQQAEIDKERARQQAEIDRKRQKDAADAERRLKEAQAAYLAELDRAQRR